MTEKRKNMPLYLREDLLVSERGNMAIQLTLNRTILLFVLLLILVTLIIAAVAFAETVNLEIIARASEGTGGVYGTIDDNISPWAIDAERSIRRWNYRA
jgi:hypothetical protein